MKSWMAHGRGNLTWSCSRVRRWYGLPLRFSLDTVCHGALSYAAWLSDWSVRFRTADRQPLESLSQGGCSGAAIAIGPNANASSPILCSWNARIEDDVHDGIVTSSVVHGTCAPRNDA